MLRAAASLGKPYDLAILDMNMPETNGLELACMIKADPAIAAVRLIMLSSLDRNCEASGAGIELTLSKPVRHSLLYDNLLTLMGSHPVAPSERPEPKEIGQKIRGRPRAHVLVVEDNIVNQEVARGMLEALGCQVDTVANGRGALEASYSIPYDLIFMDCHMPGIDGFETTKAIREREATASQEPLPQKGKALRVPIVALTADVIEGTREQCLKAGMDDYLSKPFSIDQLCAVMTRYLGEAYKVAANASEAAAPEEDPRNEGLPQSTAISMTAASVPEPPASDSIIDQTILRRICALEKGGSANLLSKVITRYLTDSTTRLQRLREAIDSMDASAVQERAHSLKSSSANLGALTLSAFLKELEMMGRMNSLQNAQELFLKIETEYRAVERALRAEVQRR